MPNLLIEIGTEELPLDALDILYADLARVAKSKLLTHRLDHGAIHVEATPRRIALFIEGLAAKQRDQAIEISGPAYDKAFDAQGNPTQVLEGFLKSKKASKAEVQSKETPKGKFVALRKEEKGKAVSKIISTLLSEIIGDLAFVKWMRWEASGFRFPRPVRWLVVLLDRNVLPVQLGDVKSGRKSRGHRFLYPKPFSIERADWSQYGKALKKAHVILRLEERERIIRKALDGRFHQKEFDEELVHMTAQLVEEPYLMEGRFSGTYLDLPSEVLASCMKKNQKIFACYDAKGRLASRFVAVLNGRRGGLAKIKRDYENVLEARLRDARYFFDADTNQALEDKYPQLEQITYLKKLGSMKQKTERLEKVCVTLARLVGRDDLKDDLKRSAHLSKIDLVTHLVYEFPDLQGIVGREYAIEAGEKEDVARAIGTQYLPKNLAESHQQLKKEMTPLGALLGLGDRLDLLAGAFGIGMEPTGSQDPFALRRAGGVFVKLIRAYGFHFSLREAIEAGLGLYGSTLTVPKSDVLNRLIGFLEERMVFELKIKPGTRAHEILEAVFKASFDDLADVYKRFEVLEKMYEQDRATFLKAAKVIERTANILKGARTEIGSIKEELFQEPLEKELFQLLKNRSGEITQALVKRDYEIATRRLGEVFHGPLHNFFDRVMVNVEDASIRSNRQALMKQIYNLYASRLADLSVLSRIDEE